MNGRHLVAAGVLVLVIALVAALVMMLYLRGGEEGGKPPGPGLVVNGREYPWTELEGLEKRTVSGSEGVSLSAIINHSGLKNPREHQYRLVASDGYSKNVTWSDMLEGALVRTLDGKNVTLKSAFPSLPKRYSVRQLVEIQVIQTDTLAVCGREYTWEQPFDTMFESVTVGGLEGIRLSDLVNHTGLSGQADHRYTLIAGDGYNKTVNWTDMLAGALVFEGHKTVFESLPKAYHIKDLVEIIAVPLNNQKG